MNLLVAFWRPILAVVTILALALALAGLKSSYDKRKRAEGAAPVIAEFAAYKAAAAAETAAITLKWDQERIKAETAGKVAADERRKRLQDASKRAQALPPAVAGVVIPAVALGVLDDALDGSRSAEIARPAEPLADHPAPAPADSTVGLMVGWAVQVIDLYDACREQVIGWQQFYSGLKSAEFAPGSR